MPRTVVADSPRWVTCALVATLCGACTRAGTGPGPVSPTGAPAGTTTSTPGSATSSTSAITTGATTTGETPSHHLERRDFATPTLPKGLTVSHGTLIWADVLGAIWTMPSDGATPPKQLSNQHREGFAFFPFVAGDKVFARSKRALLAIGIPDGPVTHGSFTGLIDLPEEAVGDATSIFVTIFSHDDVMRVPTSGGGAVHLLDAKHGVLALHGGTLYVASYTTGELTAITTATGAHHVVARALAKPTAIVADDHAVYVYTETDETVSRIDLASGAVTPLARHLNNSDELVLADDALYTVSWPNRLVKLSTTAGAAAVDLATDLDMPRSVVLDGDYLYVTSSSPTRIARVPRR
jgi:outer membrane protein assembly factor BamB